jgi:hypothetical protein
MFQVMLPSVYDDGNVKIIPSAVPASGGKISDG